MQYWLVKSEPYTYSISDLERDSTTIWDGVRNYQARNYLKTMKVGDVVLFYHSNEQPIGVAGLCTISKEATPDPSQFDKKSDYFDPKATLEKPIWFSPQMKFKEKFSNVLTLETIKDMKGLTGLLLVQKGSRLSVQPVSAAHFQTLYRRASI